MDGSNDTKRWLVYKTDNKETAISGDFPKLQLTYGRSSCRIIKKVKMLLSSVKIWARSLTGTFKD